MTAGGRQQIPRDLGTAIRAARQRAGWSLRDLGSALGLSAGFLSRLERGLRAPSSTVAADLTDVLDLDDATAARLRWHAVDDAGYARPLRTARMST